jgi:multidrug transporter EmrE-like cation transporter
MIYYIFLAVGIVLGVGGQFLLKMGAKGRDDSIVMQLLSPASIAGLALYFLAAVTYMYALRKIPVSVALPSVALSYPLVALIGVLAFGEQVGPTRIFGITLVMVGVALVNRP